MKALDIFFMVKELQSILDAKIDKIYQKENEFIFSLHKKGKILLRIRPDAIFLSNYKFVNETPPSFCMFLRKFLNQARIKQIRQKGFERIVEITLNKKQEFILIVELFSKGNIILCDSDLNIIRPLHIQQWKDRSVKPKIKYQYPPSMKYSPLKIKESDLESLSKENIVKTLAIDFGFGGVYAEEICLRADIDKEKKNLNKTEIKKIVNEIKNLLNHDLKPIIIKNEVYPFELKHLGEKIRKPYDSLSKAFDDFYIKETKEDKTYQKILKKTKEVLKKQQDHLDNLKKIANEAKIKGDLIYSNYSYIKEVIKVIKDARKKKISWEEITKKLKTRNIEVKKGGKVILDLK